MLPAPASGRRQRKERIASCHQSEGSVILLLDVNLYWYWYHLAGRARRLLPDSRGSSTLGPSLSRALILTAVARVLQLKPTEEPFSSNSQGHGPAVEPILSAHSSKPPHDAVRHHKG